MNEKEGVLEYKCKFLIILCGVLVFSVGYLTSKLLVHQDTYNLISNTNQLNLEERIKKIDSFLIKIEEKIQDSPSLVELDSGLITMTKSDFPALVNPDGCEANRGINKLKVRFNKKFLNPPQVRLALSGLDFRSSADSRIKSSVSTITEDGFTLDLLTWCDTKLSYAEVNWIAFST
ncbi:hypothetical protein FJN13_12890 [Alteromonas mediterranea]|uniref:H-type lectin domain-containing protein n=1 Tax=Alteromonas mediterranea TaxID=314275 RepID=UPI00113016C9|nr:H-type lectin domain-containing protein [Alteromonas mediterranea]QDG35636.1 hypothetical protein FJN13_12890 [Alteromonas mediterranea]